MIEDMISERDSNNLNFENVFGSRARVKILITLAKNSELSISQVIRNTNLNHSSVTKHLEFLKEINLIQEKVFGRIKILRFKIENLKASSFKRFVEIWEGDF
jgi:DNA-binding transcriptional ArsR family regulator